MSEFSIEIDALKNANASLSEIESIIRQVQEDTRGVRNNLHMESVFSIAIKAALQIQIMKMGSLNRKVGRYNQSLRQILILYTFFEEKIKNALVEANMKDCVSLQDGRSRLDVDDTEKDSVIRNFEQPCNIFSA